MKKTIIGALIAISLFLSLGAFSQYYSIENDCSNMDAFVEYNYPNNGSFQKHIQKSLFMGVGMVSKIIPLFSFDQIFKLSNCETKNVENTQG